MFLISLLRSLRGYVRFSARGLFVERFLNLLARERISVWEVRRKDDTLTGCVSAGAYPGLRALAKKTGVRLRIVTKHGVPFKKKKFRRRQGLLVGLLVFALFIGVMSRFIWSIDVNGNETVPEDRILTALESVGIKPGILRSRIAVRESEARALLELPELSWLALNIDGSTIHVEVYETMPVPPMIDPHKPCNVVASHSGQIIEMRVYAGQPLLIKGDAVLAGQVIVSGIIRDRLDQNQFKHARADIYAEVSHEITVRIPIESTAFIETGKDARRDYLRVLGVELPLFLPLGIDRPYRVGREEAPWSLLGLELPVTHRVERYTLMEEIPVTYTEDEARELAMKELAALQKAELGDADILSRELSGEIVNGEYNLRASYVCHMNIAAEREILTGGAGGALALS
ncbi:MAG: sporulation protein YqfD [Oscillospiraceae bacterium]|jgi:similar to stage IV sporulation protein|nr:sporulation protein YqfD [Oscillospiraceae bacterium]